MIGDRFLLRGVPVVVVREGPVNDRETWNRVATFQEVERDDGNLDLRVRVPGRDRGGLDDRGAGVAKNRRKFPQA